MDPISLLLLGGAFYAGVLVAAKLGLTYEKASAPIKKVARFVVAAANQKPKIESEQLNKETKETV